MNLKCIIVEDEPLAVERARQYIGRVPFLSLAGEFENGRDALIFLQRNRIDILLLDINMGEHSGIQLLESGAVFCAVVLTTAFDEYAIKGFDLNVTDYLLKPYTFERFMQAINKVKTALPSGSANEFIFIKTEYRLERVMLDDILYIEGMRDYRKIHTRNKKIMTLKTFGELEAEISPSLICRIHKSYMVSMSKIDWVEKDSVKVGSHSIPVSQTYKKVFFELFGK